MGAVISLATRRREGSPAAPRTDGRGAVTCYFDLWSAATYLAAERVDRLFPDACWVPVLGEGPLATPAPEDPRLRAAAERRAAHLRMPLFWPEPVATPSRAAMRVASLASETGRGGAFVLAAGRLAYCGGFDLGDPEILAEAAAAAGLDLDACLAAAGDPLRDAAMAAEGRRLLRLGAAGLPALRVGRRLFCGEERIAEAAAAARADAVAPAGGRRSPRLHAVPPHGA